MKIGLTYDLRDDYLNDGYTEEQTAEFDREDTIDAIEAALRANGLEVERIGRARRLIERLAARRALGPGVQHRGGPARRRAARRRSPRSWTSTASPTRSRTRS